jgi:hypothetical protein
MCDAAVGVLDDDQDVKPAQEDGVDVGEVDGEDRLRVGGDELLPRRPRPRGDGPRPAALRIFHTVDAARAWPSPDELALDASVSPPRILPGQLEHQVTDG